MENGEIIQLFMLTISWFNEKLIVDMYLSQYDIIYRWHYHPML